MLLIRRVEEAAAKAYAAGKIGGFLHLGIGQEAICTAAIDALTPHDYVCATYREHGHYLCKGGSAKEVLAELYGRSTGASKGVGGSMHLFSQERGFLGGYGIVGGHVPLAAGAAFSAKYRGSKQVALCFFGDGSVPQGAFHEGAMLAQLWKLPLVLICENNQYSMGTPLSRTWPVDDFTKQAAGYGMAHDRFTAEDVLEVRRRMAAAIERARTESLPTLIEVITYRFRGHSMSDPGNYRTKDEIEQWKQRDALPRARAQLIELGASEAEVKEIDQAVKAEVDEAVKFADESPVLDPEALWPMVYADPSTHDPRRS